MAGRDLRALACKHTFHIACPLACESSVPPFLCTRRVRYLVCCYVLPRYSAWVHVHVRSRAVCVYKSDLIALDDSSVNIRALTAEA